MLVRVSSPNLLSPLRRVFEQDFHLLLAGNYQSRFAIKKKSGSPGLRTWTEVSRITFYPHPVAVFLYRALS